MIKEIVPRRLGPEQIKYVDKVFGHAYWRDRLRMVEPTHCNLPEPTRMQ